MNAQPDRVTATWLALLLFGIYLLTYSGQIYSGDGMSMFSVTESFVKRGEFNTDQLWTLFKSRNEIAADGESYAKYGFGTSLFIAPLYALALVLPGIGLAQTTLLASAIAMAITGALVFLAARRLNFSRTVSVIVALLFGLATPAWVYARQLWSEPFGAATLFAAFYALMCYREHGRPRDAIIAGSALGLAMATRLTNAALVPLFVWYGFERVLNGTKYSRRMRNDLAIFAFPLILVALAIAAYDWSRFGSALATGYRADETFDNPILLGAYGLLFSPGKGLFVYVPFFAALAFSFMVFFRRAKRETILIFAIFAFYVLLFSSWYYWWGGTSWGPRFLVPTLPFLVLTIAPAVELAIAKTRKMFTLVFFALVALSLAIELLGISIPALAYRVRMVRVSTNAEMDAVFLPAFSPLVGYFDLLKPRALDFAWLNVTDGNVNVDWLIVGFSLAFVIFCCVMLYQAPFAIRNSQFAIPFVIIFVFLLSLFALHRAYDDARLGGSAGYRALLQTVQRESHANDVMILNDDARTPFFLNENRAAIRWYGLSRDPKQFDRATRELLVRAQQNHARIWFAYDNINADLPNPTRDWLNQSLAVIAQSDFEDDVHLILYAADVSR